MAAVAVSPNWRAGLIALAFIASPVLHVSAQELSVSTVGDSVYVRARAFGFIEGEALDRLKDGRSVRFDFELDVLAKPAGPVVTEARQSFNLSYDLWEQRFAVTQIGTPSRSSSHLTLPLAEAWCLEHLTLPVSAFGHLGRDAPFWLRLGYRIPDRDRAKETDGNSTFTLRSLIDRLSRRRSTDDLGNSVVAGPFRLPNRP
jgi:hypothetical protein